MQTPILISLVISTMTTLCYKPIKNKEDNNYKIQKVGKRLFEKSCVLCHGITGLADGPASNSIALKPRELRIGKMKNKVEFNAIYQIIRNGIDETPMPAFKDDYSPSQREKITRYILYLANLKD